MQSVKICSLNLKTIQVPIKASVVVLPIEKLNLLKGVHAGEIAADFRMHCQKCVEGCCASFLWTNHQKSGQLLTCFVVGPNLLMTQIIAWILEENK
jgi:hypothetical protein